MLGIERNSGRRQPEFIPAEGLDQGSVATQMQQARLTIYDPEISLKVLGDLEHIFTTRHSQGHRPVVLHPHHAIGDVGSNKKASSRSFKQACNVFVRKARL